MFKSQWELRGKMQATKLWLVLVLHLIGWKSDTSFLDQSLSVVKQKQRYRKLLLPLHWKLLYQYKKTNINLNGEIPYQALSSGWIAVFCVSVTVTRLALPKKHVIWHINSVIPSGTSLKISIKYCKQVL